MLLAVPAGADGVVVTENMLYVIASVAISTATVTGFIYNGFSKTRNLISESQKNFYRVISRHNREDDERFAALSDDIWNLRVRAANRDGTSPPPRRTFPQRRYLIDDEHDQNLGEENYGEQTG